MNGILVIPEEASIISCIFRCLGPPEDPGLLYIAFVIVLITDSCFHQCMELCKILSVREYDTRLYIRYSLTTLY